MHYCGRWGLLFYGGVGFLEHIFCDPAQSAVEYCRGNGNTFMDWAKFLPSYCFVACTASLALGCGFFIMGLHHSMIIFIFTLSIGLKTLQILGLESHKKGGGVRRGRMECVEGATLQFSGWALFLPTFRGLWVR